MTDPMNIKALFGSNSRKNSPKTTAPTLPPAPMIPEIEPVVRVFTYGTMLKIMKRRHFFLVS